MQKIELSKIKSAKKKSELVFEVVEALRGGAIAIAPVEQGYVFIADTYSTDAISRIRRLKGVGEDIYFPILVGNIEHIAPFCGVISPEQRLLAMEFWPGLLILECEALPGISDSLSTKYPPESLFFRCTSNLFIREICELMGSLTYTPVMKDGSIITDYSDIATDVLEECQFLITQSKFEKEVTPSIVSFVGKNPTLSKEGAISESRIRRLISNLQVV